jgi:hypothetical protein
VKGETEQGRERRRDTDVEQVDHRRWERLEKKSGRGEESHRNHRSETSHVVRYLAQTVVVLAEAVEPSMVRYPAGSDLLCLTRFERRFRFWVGRMGDDLGVIALDDVDGDLCGA